MKRFFLLALLLFGFRTVFAEADDVTLIHSPEALYVLEQQQQAQLITSRKEEVILEVNDAVIEADRILVRFLIHELPISYTKFITEENRLYGEYLPVAEVGTPGGKWISPSSESRYSLAASGNTVILGGVLSFPTDERPRIISFNFNQLPFDTQPLSEGSVMQLAFTDKDPLERNHPENPAMVSDELDFSIRNTAQTDSLHMVQPAVQMLRADETLSQFGWISVRGVQTGSLYAVTRGPLYGFNLADDESWAPGHAYVFGTSADDEQYRISMDYAYIKRDVHDEIDLSAEEIPLTWEDHEIRITGTMSYTAESEGHAVPTLRIYAEGDETVSYIGFSQPGSVYEDEPAVCGIEETGGRFACDITLEDIAALPARLKINAFEYRKDGPWECEWTPIPLPAGTQKTDTPEIYPLYDIYTQYSGSDETLKRVSDGLEKRSAALAQKPGWIRLAVLVDDTSAGESPETLVPHQQLSVLKKRYVNEVWYRIREDGLTNESIVLLRDPSTAEILTGTWTFAGTQVVLPQALRFPGNAASYYAVPFSYDNDFFSVLETGARYDGSHTCGEYQCLTFTQSLLPTASSPKQVIVFSFDPETSTIPHMEIYCGDDELCLSKDLIALEFSETLPEDLRALTENIVL